MTSRADKSVIILVILLILIGLTAVYSSTSVVPPSLQKDEVAGSAFSQFNYLKKQCFTVALGIVAMIVAFKIPLPVYRKLAIPLLIISLVGILLVFTGLGISAGGARRWLRLWPSSFQPSELVKLAMVIFLAWFMSRSVYDKDKIMHFAIPIGVMAVFQVVFMLQPDFGATMSLAILTIALLYLSGTRMRYIVALGIAALPAVVYLAMAPYRLKRIVTFLDPWKDPQGAGFQLTQSFIAFGSGGFDGVGLGESKQKLAFLPEVHTDFIFSLVGEELGFIGAAVVVGLFLLLFFRGFMIARRTEDAFAYYLAIGLSLMIAVQAVVNFAVVTGLAPTKGLPLPFISYGGSSLVVSMVAMGLLLNVSRYRSENAVRSTMHISNKITTEFAEGVEEGKPSQYAFSRGYVQYRHRTRPVRKSGNK